MRLKRRKEARWSWAGWMGLDVGGAVKARTGRTRGLGNSDLTRLNGA